MTDTELKRRKAICEAAHVDEIDDVSDGFHTFRQLYYQRMMLFATIVKQNKDKAWKSLRHEDGELCFGGEWFIVGVDTPEGSYTYHYENNYFSLFDCEELERGKHWDGHTEKDVTRLLSLSPAQPKERTKERTETHACDLIDRQAAIDAIANCTNCGTPDELRKYVDKHSLENGWTGGVLDAMEAVEDIPAADVVPVRLGEWLDGYKMQTCSLCKCRGKKSWTFCPHCGARMIYGKREE